MAVVIGMSLIGPNWKRLRTVLRNMEPIDTRRALFVTGEFLKLEVRKGILSGRPGGVRLEKNAPATERKKGFNKPWVETGQTAAEVDQRMIRRQGVVAVFIGLERSRIHIKDPRRRVARIGRFHEFGTATEPVRSVFGSVLNAELLRIRELFSNALGTGIGFVGPINPNF